jgi:aminopeptidase N
VPGSVDRSSLDLEATYDVDVRLEWESRLLAVDSTMTVRNTSGGPIDRLELNTIAARLGGMTLESVAVEDMPVPATVDDQTIVVPLGGILPEGASATVRVVYRATLRTGLGGSDWLFTRANGIINAYRWLPWVSRAVPFDRPNHGDPFVTPVSPEVTVRITTDRPMGLATTGERIEDAGLTQHFRAANVRDFVITASPTYRTSSATEGDTTVRVFYRDGAPAAAMIDAARDALREMEALVGPYPHTTFNVAQSAGGYGMEGPGIIWIPTGVGSANLRYLVTHETAHQWFYGLVGSDQAAEPFTDEAMADFLARYVLGQRRASRCAGARLDLPIYDYSSTCYYETVYIQGGNLIDDLRREIGNDAFWTAVRGWVDEHRHAIASTRSLLDALDAATSADLAARLRSRFPSLYD